eukprot:12275445-Heterocapsa_arctica.AAC.1
MATLLRRLLRWTLNSPHLRARLLFPFLNQMLQPPIDDDLVDMECVECGVEDQLGGRWKRGAKRSKERGAEC